MQKQKQQVNSIKFICKVKDHQCWSKDKKGKITVCSWSPCQLNLYEFSMHGRIIENYLDIEEWDEAYYYFDSLLTNLPISCDLEHLKKNPNANINDLPPGCRVFKESFELKDIKRILKRYKKLLLEGGEISKTGKSIYESEKLKFAKKLQGNLERLKHLAKDKQVKKADSEDYQQKLLELYSTAFRAKKEGLNVETGVGSALEKGFEDAAKGAGLKTKELAEFNKKRVEQAKKDIELNKFKNEIFGWLKEGKDLTPEMKIKLKALGMG